ncbi:TPA: DUF3667 domain-containing protein [Stenotrophomonas maltophilia]
MSSTDTAHAACENCDTALHGHYCHRCGQSAHNPLKHVGHAIEEVFESFWHLDGRIFRTLRDLWVPGRIALNYLKGRRVGYVQPLRLFVILTLFTFFVGKLFVHVDDFGVGGGRDSVYAKATTVEQVEAARARQLALIDQQQASSPATGNAGFTMARAAVNAAAAQRRAGQSSRAPAPSPLLKPPRADTAPSSITPSTANRGMRTAIPSSSTVGRSSPTDGSTSACRTATPTSSAWAARPTSTCRRSSPHCRAPCSS